MWYYYMFILNFISCLCKKNWTCKFFFVHWTIILDENFIEFLYICIIWFKKNPIHYIFIYLIIFLDPGEGYSSYPNYWINFIWHKSFLYFSVTGWILLFLFSWRKLSHPTLTLFHVGEGKFFPPYQFLLNTFFLQK